MKNFLLTLLWLSISTLSFTFTACEAESTSEMEELYENSIDKKKLRTVKTGKRDQEEDSNE